ncbi:MAG: TetR/AcrR family transcriptional regulator [Bacillota bacterium]
MEEVFENINPEKRDQIINSALKEFSKNSFDKASTNNIVKNADISKGLLYHYFDSKKSLYEHLKVFAFKITIDAVLEEIDWEESDIFKRIKQIALVKFKVWSRYPYLLPFSKKMYQNSSIEEMKKMTEKYAPNIYQDVYYRNIDFDLFKDNIDKEKVLKITEWVMEKLGEEWLAHKIKMEGDIDFEEMIAEIDEYLNILQEAFYK